MAVLNVVNFRRDVVRSGLVFIRGLVRMMEPADLSFNQQVWNFWALNGAWSPVPGVAWEMFWCLMGENHFQVAINLILG